VRSVRSYRAAAAVSVSDMSHATDFYERKLGLTAPRDNPDGGRTYGCGGQTMLHVFPSVGAAGTSPATVAGWSVNDVQSVVDELTAKDVEFERYDEPPMVTDEKGIAVLGTAKAAWVKDPEGDIALPQDSLTSHRW
jgi:catechol-2,3-dioxygenase